MAARPPRRTYSTPPKRFGSRTTRAPSQRCESEAIRPRAQHHRRGDGRFLLRGRFARFAAQNIRFLSPAPERPRAHLARARREMTSSWKDDGDRRARCFLFASTQRRSTSKTASLALQLSPRASAQSRFSVGNANRDVLHEYTDAPAGKALCPCRQRVPKYRRRSHCGCHRCAEYGKRRAVRG